jgi:two-component system NtrC family sensor kinase
LSEEGDRVKENELETQMTARMLSNLVTCQKLALLGRLSSSITHEVNNHLTGVTGYAQLLLTQDRAQAIARELGKINASANRCQKLIADFKRFARFGGAELEFNNINLIVKDSLDILRHQFSKKTIHVVEDYCPDVPPTEVDTPSLEQAFLNIIQNALEALDEKENGKLCVTTSLDGDKVTVTFKDDGAGLTDEALANLFSPFFTTKSALRCIGLGLAVAKTLIERHGGRIEVSNSPECGACVKVSLPCPRAAG